MILTIDIGLKNLALCIMSCSEKKELSTYAIHFWETINTLEDTIPCCNGVTKGGTICGKQSCKRYKVKQQEEEKVEYTCKTHFPKTIKSTKWNTITKKKVQDFLLQDIARLIIKKIQDVYETNLSLFQQLKKIHIELQPKVNNKMKMISHIIYGKLVDIFQDNQEIQIRFIRAAQKLKAYNGPVVTCNLKTPYSKRKFLAVEYTKWILTNKFSEEQVHKWYSHFMNNKKKDDLSDVYLMALNGLKV